MSCVRCCILCSARGPCHALAHLTSDFYSNAHRFLMHCDPSAAQKLQDFFRNEVMVRDLSGVQLSWKEVKLLCTVGFPKFPEHAELNSLAFIIKGLICMFRAAGPPELFIRNAGRALQLWKRVFPAVSGYSFRPSVHCALEHLPAYAFHLGEFWTVLCSEEAGEKAHQDSQAEWKSSTMMMETAGRLHGSGSASILMNPLRCRLLEVLTRFSSLSPGVGSCSDVSE